MFLNLVVSKPESLKAVLESRLGGAHFGKEVDGLGVIREHLLDVVVSEVDYTVSIRPHQASHSVGENNLTLARCEEFLDFVVLASELFSEDVALVDVMVLLWELHSEVISVIFEVECFIRP